MGKRRAGPYIIWRVTVPEEIAVEIELMLVDPLRNKPEYGGRSHLITSLLMKFLAEAKEQNK